MKPFSYNLCKPGFIWRILCLYHYRMLQLIFLGIEVTIQIWYENATMKIVDRRSLKRYLIVSLTVTWCGCKCVCYCVWVCIDTDGGSEEVRWWWGRGCLYCSVTSRICEDVSVLGCLFHNLESRNSDRMAQR